MRFFLFGNAYQQAKSGAIGRVVDSLRARGDDIFVEPSYGAFLRESGLVDLTSVAVKNPTEVAVDFAISLGGDGTFLSAATQMLPSGTPVLGVNMGRLGFLADIGPDEVDTCIEALHRGDYTVERRAVIAVTGVAAGASDALPVRYALNDVCVLKRDTASMISIRTTVDGEYLTTYQADGLIVATPTGSTAYSLSNGGPVIVPGTGVLALTAVAPHSLWHRTIVVPDSSEITLTVSSRSHTFLLALDGNSEKLPEGTTLTLRRAPVDVHVVKRAGRRYFDTLRQKMMWGADNRGFAEPTTA